jgi:hypothetical protein
MPASLAQQALIMLMLGTQVHANCGDGYICSLGSISKNYPDKKDSKFPGISTCALRTPKASSCDVCGGCVTNGSPFVSRVASQPLLRPNTQSAGLLQLLRVSSDYQWEDN